MADRIKLTPGELQAQAMEMSNLEAQYTMLFGNVISELNKVNHNWSPNLAHNFSGKITSAQKKFTRITQLLQEGAKVADTCAVTFESVDSKLSKLYGYGQKSAVMAGKVAGAQNTSEDDSKNKRSIKDDINELERIYNGLSEEEKILIKMLCHDDLEKAYEIASAIAQEGITVENVYKIAKKAIGKSIKAKAAFKSIEYSVDTGAERFDEFNEEAKAQLREGDIYGFFGEYAEGLVDVYGGGMVEVLFGLAGGAVDKVISKVPVVGYFFEDLTGYYTDGKSVGDLIALGGQKISEGLDIATDFLSAGMNYVTDVQMEGAEEVRSWLGEILD